MDINICLFLFSLEFCFHLYLLINGFVLIKCNAKYFHITDAMNQIIGIYQSIIFKL